MTAVFSHRRVVLAHYFSFLILLVLALPRPSGMKTNLRSSYVGDDYTFNHYCSKSDCA